MTDLRGAALIRATGISVHFGPKKRPLRAVDGVDLDVGKGEALGVVGESGSGKSTLARAIAGLQPLTGGEVSYDGRRLPERRSHADQRRIQMVFQDPYASLNPRLTVGGMLAELLRVHHVVPRAGLHEAVGELVALVGLDQDAVHAYPRQFSGGQRQRIAIARALALAPDVLIADEPVSALDVSVQATILNLLRDLRAELGLTLVMISHNLAVVRHLCDRVAVMYLGRIIEAGPAGELLAAPRHPYTRALIAAVPRLAAGGLAEAGPRPAELTGDPPSPLRLPSGCRFRTRCPIAKERCAAEDPALTPAPGCAAHMTACHFPGVTVGQPQVRGVITPLPGERTSHYGGHGGAQRRRDKHGRAGQAGQTGA
jgi:oligopeptide/dipeptide ABC transporter ATP-binding protein